MMDDLISRKAAIDALGERPLEIPDQLRIWLSDDRYQKRISVVVDTNELSIDFALREGADHQ